MLKLYIDWARENATPRNILGSLAGLFLIEGIFVGLLFPEFAAITDGGTVPDTKFGYSYAEIYAAIDGYGPEGIQFYRYIEAVDLLFPLVYGSFLALLMARLFLSLDVEDSVQPLLYLPLVAATLDYLENAGIFVMLWRHPGEYALVATVTNAVTMLKFTGIGLSILGILIAAVLLLSRRVR